MHQPANPYASPGAQPAPAGKRIGRTALIVAGAGVALLGTLATIAVPAYNDYAGRVRSTQLLMHADPWRQAISDYYDETKKLPSTAGDLGRKEPSAGASSPYGTVAMGANGVLTLSTPEGQTLVMRPQPEDGRVQWNCTGGTMETRYRPFGCRAN